MKEFKAEILFTVIFVLIFAVSCGDSSSTEADEEIVPDSTTGTEEEAVVDEEEVVTDEDVVDVDPCEGVLCSDHGTCMVTDGEAYCECDTCYAAEGLTCIRETVEVDASDITSATTWKSHQIINLNQSIYVNSALIIEECAVVKVKEDGAIYVSDEGSIVSNGTTEHPVTFTSSKSTPAAGDWRNIEIYSSANNGNKFENTVFEYGGGNEYGMLWVESEAEVAVDNTLFRNGKHHAVQLENGVKLNSFEGNSFDTIDGVLIEMYPETITSLSPVTSTNNTRNVILIQGGDTATDGMWKDLSVPYETDGSIYIQSVIEIEKNTTVLVGDDKVFYVNDSGVIKALGTETEPVIFKSAKSSPDAGDWRNIEIYSSAGSDNKFDYTEFSHGGKNEYGMLYVEDGAAVEVTNSSFKMGLNHAIHLDNGAEIGAFTGNSFDTIGGPLIKMYPAALSSLSPVTSTNNTEEVIYVSGGDTEVDGTWKNLSVPYLFDGYIYIYDEITVEKGTSLLIGDDKAFYVQDGGSLILDGTSDDHITLTSGKSSPAAGDWRNIEIYDSSSANNRFSFTDISFGGSGGTYGQLYIEDGATIALEDVTFADGMICDVYEDGTVNATNTTYNSCPM